MYLSKLSKLSSLLALTLFTTTALSAATQPRSPTPSTLPEENVNTIKFLLYNTTDCSNAPFDVAVLEANQEVAAQNGGLRTTFDSFNIVDVGTNVPINGLNAVGGANSALTEFSGTTPLGLAVEGCNTVPGGALRAVFIVFSAAKTL